jgi:hypothetical protein
MVLTQLIGHLWIRRQSNSSIRCSHVNGQAYVDMHLTIRYFKLTTYLLEEKTYTLT